MHRSLPRISALALALAIPCARPAAAQPAARPPAALDSLIRANMAGANIVGLGAAVIVERKVVWSQGWGFADADRRVPFSAQTVLKVASITKTFTGVALMQAVQAGKLSLDADINTYLPFRVVHPRHPTARITLRHLATHTSGIADHPDTYRATYRWGTEPTESLGDFLTSYFTPGAARYSAANFIDAAPGTQREYCNICAGLAGFIVERATGERLDRLTRRTILTPLGMRYSGWHLADLEPRLRSTHFVSHNGFAVPIPHYSGVTYPDGGLHTSVDELSRFFVAMLNDGALDGVRILDAERAREMQRLQFTAASHPTNFPPTEGNSGIFWRTKLRGALVGHGGNDPGVSADMLASLDGRTAFIVLMNTSVAGEDGKAVGAIWNAIRTHAESLRSGGGAR